VSRRVGLFGGTFDPVHTAHLWVAAAAQAHLGWDRVVWIPAFVSPHKLETPPTEGPHRLRMLELALADRPGWSVWTHELDAGRPCPTVDTVAAWARRHPEDRLWFLLGADALASLPRWIRPRELLATVRLAVYARPGAPPPGPPPGGPDAEIDVIPGVRHDVSATAIRARLAAGQPTPELPPAVRDYIQTHRLYGTGARRA